MADDQKKWTIIKAFWPLHYKSDILTDENVKQWVESERAAKEHIKRAFDCKGLIHGGLGGLVIPILAATDRGHISLGPLILGGLATLITAPIGTAGGIAYDVITAPFLIGTSAFFGCKALHHKIEAGKKVTDRSMSIFLIFWSALQQMAMILIVLGHETEKSIKEKAIDKTGQQFYGIAKLTICAMSFHSLVSGRGMVTLPNGYRIDIQNEVDPIIKYWGNTILKLKNVLQPLMNAHMRLEEAADSHHQLFLDAIPYILNGREPNEEHSHMRFMYRKINDILKEDFKNAQQHKPNLDFDNTALTESVQEYIESLVNGERGEIDENDPLYREAAIMQKIKLLKRDINDQIPYNPNEVYLGDKEGERVVGPEVQKLIEEFQEMQREIS